MFSIHSHASTAKCTCLTFVLLFYIYMYSKLGIFTFTSVKKKVNGTSILQLYIQNQTLKRESDIYRKQLGATSRNEVRSKLLQMYINVCKVPHLSL